MITVFGEEGGASMDNCEAILSLSRGETIILSAPRREMTSAVCTMLAENETNLRQLCNHLSRRWFPLRRKWGGWRRLKAFRLQTSKLAIESEWISNAPTVTTVRINLSSDRYAEENQPRQLACYTHFIERCHATPKRGKVCLLIPPSRSFLSECTLRRPPPPSTSPLLPTECGSPPQRSGPGDAPEIDRSHHLRLGRRLAAPNQRQHTCVCAHALLTLQPDPGPEHCT